MSFNAKELFSVNGLVAVITGGGTGIGSYMAKALAQNGAHKIYIVGRRKETLEKLAETYPSVITPLVADITSKESLLEAAKQVEADLGYINVLVANAGVVHFNKDPAVNSTASEIQEALLNDRTVETFQQTMDANLLGVYCTIAAFLPLLDAGNKKRNVAQKSQVIATSSNSALNHESRAGIAYALSKAALLHLMNQLPKFVGPLDIRTNSIAPGLFPSEMSEPIFGDEMTNEGSFPKNFLPATRAGKPEEMAGLILFLTSPAGAYVNGSVFLMDGGRNIMTHHAAKTPVDVKISAAAK